MSARRRLGLVLGGGCGKGSAHLGVLRVLEELQVPIDIIVGSSIGAIVGVLKAAGYDVAAIEAGFRSARLHRILEFDSARWGILGTGKLHAMLADMLGDRAIEELPITYAAVTVDLISGREIHLTSGSAVEAALATSAVPGVFPPIKHGEMLLADGGIFNNVPVDVAQTLGAGRTIAVDLMGLAHQLPMPEMPPSLSIRRVLPLTGVEFAERAVELMVHRMTEQRLRRSPPDLLLTPDVSAISMFAVTRIDEGCASGEDSARRHVDDLLALREWRLAGE